MTQYKLNVQATSNTSINTEDTFVELKAATGVTIKVKRIRVGFSDGTATAGVDNHFRVKIARWDTSTAGSSASGTMNPVNANANAATSTAKVKNGTTALALGTTNVTVLDLVSINGRALYEWLARDDDDMYVTKTAGFLGIVIQSAVASQLFTVTADFVE